MTDLETGIVSLKERAETYAFYEAYYRGDHRLAFATEKFKSAFGYLFQALALNHCRPVVDALADRLTVDGFAVEGRQAKRSDPTRAQDAGDAAWGIWQWNRMGQDAGEVHLEALRCADAYVIAWPNPEGQVTLYPQRARYVTVQYDEERPGRIQFAVKCWRQRDGKWRATVYYPDRLEKWITPRAVDDAPSRQIGWEEYRPENEAWPLPHDWEQVPVFHFANNAAVGAMGESYLTDVIPVQDALNKAVADMMVAMEFTAYAQRYVTGLEIHHDAEGRPISPFKGGADRVWAVENPDVKFGQFPFADLTQLVKVQDSFRTEIARISGTPLHYMMLLTDPPSGEALKTLESRLVKRARDRMEAWGRTWADVMTLALRMANVATTAPIVTEWADPAPKSEREKAEGLGMLTAAGAALEPAAMVAGYSDEEARELGKPAANQPVTRAEKLRAAVERRRLVDETS